MERLKEKGLTLNRNKCAFNKTTLELFGQIFSSNGTSPDPKKVEDIKEAAKPQTANGDAERFMKNLGKIIRAASSEGRPWKQKLNKFLRNYRATPHITTGVAPAIALFGRQPKIKLPALPRPSNDDQLRKRDAKSKVQIKAYADKHNHARACSYKKGDAVLVKQPRSNKLTPAYDPVPYRITATNGSMITVSRDDHVITRNSSFFKKIPERTEDNDRDVNDVELREEIHQPDAADDPPDEDASLSRPSRERRRPQYLNDYTT